MGKGGAEVPGGGDGGAFIPVTITNFNCICRTICISNYIQGYIRNDTRIYNCICDICIYIIRSYNIYVLYYL